MNFILFFITSFISIFIHSGNEPAEILIQHTCELNQAIQKDLRSESYELDYKFHKIIKDNDFIESKGYYLDLIFVLKNTQAESKKLNFEFHFFRLNDKRDSLLNKERLTEEFKKLFIEFLPSYLNLIDKNQIGTDCKFLTYKIKLLVCY